MDYVPLGRSGLKVSPLCLGTMMFGGPTDEQDSGRIIASRARSGHQLHRHGRRLRRRPLGGDHRPCHRSRAQPLGAGDQGLQSDGRGTERSRPLAALADARLRGQPAPPRDRLDRHLLPAQGGPLHAAGGDGECRRRPDPPGQDPLSRPLQLPRLADRRDRPPVRPGRHRPAARAPALLQRAQPHAGGRAPPGLRPLRAGRGALQPARPRRAHRQVRPGRAAARPRAAPAGRTSG